MATEKKRKSNAELYREYQSSKNNKQESNGENTSKRLSNKEIYKIHTVNTLLEQNPNIVEDLNSRMQQFNDSYNSFFSNYQSADDAKKYSSQLKSEATALSNMLSKYGVIFDDSYVSEVSNWLNDAGSSIDDGVKHWSQWATKDDYDAALRQNGYYTKYQNMSAEDETKALATLQSEYDKYYAQVGEKPNKAAETKVAQLKEELDYLHTFGKKETQIAGRKQQYTQREAEIAQIDSQLTELNQKADETYTKWRYATSGEASKYQALHKAYTNQISELKAKRDALSAENTVYNRSQGAADDAYLEYSSLASQDDFNTYVQKGESLDNGKRYNTSDSIVQLNPNKVAAERNIEGFENYTDEQKLAQYANSLYLNMTEEEVALYNYYLGKEGSKSADAFLNKLKPELERRKSFSNEEMWNFHMNKEGFEGAFNTVFFNAASVIAKPFVEATAFVDNTLNQAGELVGLSEGINPYSEWQTGRNTVNAIRKSTTEAIEAIDPNAKFLGQNVWGQVYNAGMSTLDSLYGVALFGSWYTAIAASGAASNKAAELYEKGATSEQIFFGGTAAGLAEAVFEKVSIDNLIKTKNPDVWYKAIFEALKQGGIEASEEVLTEAANILTDSIIMGSQSDLSLAIKAYQEEGLSYEEAFNKALKDKAMDVAWAGLSGLISGTASGGLNTTFQGVKNSSTGKGIKKQGDTEAMILAGIDASQGSQAYDLSQKAFRDYTEGDALYRFAQKVTGADSKITKALSNNHGAGNVSNMRLGALQQTAMENVVDQYRNTSSLSESEIKSKLVSKGIDDSQAAKFAKIVSKIVDGGKLSEREAETIKGNEIAQEVANEVANAQAVNNLVANMQLNKIVSLGRAVEPETPDTYDVSKIEGKTLLKDSNAEVKIVDIASIDNGKMMLKVNDGKEVKEVNAENISFATNDDAILYEMVAQMDMDTASARAIIGNFDAKNSKSVKHYILGAYEAFNYGKYNFATEEMSKNGFSADLTEADKTFAYNLGKNVQVTNVNAQESAVKKAIEGAKKSNKVQDGEKGKVIYESGETTLNDRQKASVKSLEVIAKALGINIYLYETTLDDKNRRAYINKEGKRITANGYYNPETGDIHIDINAGQNGEGIMLFTAAHELTHFIRQWSPAKFKVLADFLISEYGKEGVPVAELVRAQQDLAKRQGRKLSYDQAYEEMIADSMEAMLADGAVVEKLSKLAKKDMTLVEKMVDWIDKLVKDIKKEYAGITHSTSAGEYAAMLNEGERLQELFYDALVSAGSNYKGAGGKTNIANAEMRLMARELGNDLGNIERTDNGDIALITNKDNSLVLYSPRTYEEGGRDKLEATLKANGHTQEEINDTLKLIDDAADYMRILAAGYAKMNYGKFGERLSELLEATVTTDLKGHKQVLSTLVNNGDYPVNLDLALICKKRVAYMRLMTRLIEDGVFGDVVYGGDAIAEVNGILRENGFETACLGCFVESRRLQFQTWAETIVQEWNEAVDAHTKNAGYFGFAKGGKGNLTEADMDAMEAELSTQKKNDKGNVNLGQGSAVTRMNRLLDKMPSLAKKLTVDDLLTPQGLTTLRQADGNLFSLVKSRYGAASPKIVQEFSPYASEIAKLTFSYVKEMTGESISGANKYRADAEKELAAEKPVKQKGESKEDFNARRKAWKEKAESLAMNNYLFAIGGARIQSFSDFMIENVFDYIQIMADLAAKGSPLHGYTKEIACLRLFGMTGAKWNGSLIAHVDRSMGKEYAGLLPASEAKNGNAILVHTPKGDFAIGFDDYARHMATNKKSFIQSIGMKDIVALMLDPRYSANVGNITIGVSDMQILGMLDSPLFRMVIPYHASGMLPQFAQLVGVDFYNDYTNYQNTTVKAYFDLEGNPVESLKDAKGDALKPDMSYKYNEVVQKLSKKGVKDAPRQAANNYIAWCGKMHPVYDGKKRVGYATLNPKFSDSPTHVDFSKHKNYYKLLEDFNMYDNNTESAAMQEAVKMVLPSEANRLNAEQMDAYKQALRDTGLFSEAEITKYAKKADMTFEEIIKAEMDNRQAYEEETDPKWDATVKKVEDHLKKHHPRDGQAKSAEDYANAKGKSSISSVKAVDGSYAIQLADNNIKRSERDSDVNTLTDSIQGLDSYSVDEVVDIVKGHIQSILDEYGEFAEIIAVRPYGSRAKGTARSGSDLDIVVQYEGDISEDAMFNMLNDEDSKLYIEDIEVDINPIRADKSGDIDDYLGRVYDFDKYSEDNPDFRYSARDSEGNTLTKAQQEFFKDSKVRDEKGNLLVCYHGTNSNFNVFSKDNIGIGYWFTEDKLYANHFGKNIKQVYLKLTNPLDMDTIEGDETLATVKKTLFAEQTVDETYLLSNVVKEELKRLGYDGIMWNHKGKKTIISFGSNQIKLTTNTNPTSDPDIRYSERINDFQERVIAAQDLRDEARQYGHKLSINYDGSVTVYHGTSAENAEKIRTTGIINEQSYFTTRKSEAEYYAKKKHKNGTILELKIDARNLELAAAGEELYSPVKLKNINGIYTSNDDIMYSERDYSYDELVSKPDMQVKKLPDVSENEIARYKQDTGLFAKDMRKIAADVGNKKNTPTSTYLYCRDLDADVLITKESFKHGAERFDGAYVAVCKSIADVLENSIVVNELKARDNTNGSYVLLGLVQNADDYIIVRSVISKKTWKLEEYNELYAIKKKSVKKEDVGLKPPHYTQKSGFGTSSSISIADFLKFVNSQNLGNSVLSADVVNTLNTSRGFDENITPHLLYSERDPDSTSNRSLLANALEDTVQNDIEKNKLQQYKEKIAFINAEERKLADLNKQLRELRFSKGKRDAAKNKQINDLQAEATKTANRISTYDKQLLNLETTTALKNVLEREKAKVRKQQKLKDAEILKKQREEANATIINIMNRNTESRKKAVEGRHKTVVRNKIKRVLNDLNQVFNRGTKERNVKIGLRDTVRKALEASEVLFSDEITNEDIVRLGVDSVNAEEQEKLERYATLLALRATKEDAAEIGKINNQIAKLNRDLKDVFIRERAKLNKESVSTALDSLADAYASLKDSDDDYIKNNAFVEGMHDRIKSLSKDLNGVTIKDMSLEQLEQVYKMYASVKHMIVSANSIFRDGLREDLSEKIMAVQGEILALQKDNRKDPRAFVDAINNAIRSFDWNNQKPVYAFEKLGSQAFQELFWDVIKAEGVYAQDVVEAGDFLDAQKDKFNYADWDFKKAKTFKSANNLDFKLTLSDMMSIYAYSKRPQAFDHMTQGGFTFDRGSTYVDEKGKKRKHVRLSETYTVSIELINEIVNTLTEEQISYVDAVQAYLTSLGEKGNEVSRVLYGIDLFTEQVYFPLKSDADYRSSVEQSLNETQTQVSLKNTGMSKQTVPHANNPIVLQGFDDVVLGHVDNMSKYHSFVLPIENLRRVFDNVSRDENASYDATKVIIESVFGESAKQYFDQYITDLNGGIHIGGYQNIFMDLFSKMKKTAVSASLSVVVQQPFAITRAMDRINPVYFAPVNFNAAKKTDADSQWEEIKKYAPVAIIKEMGGFDVGSNRTTKDYIGGTNYKGFKGKVKGFFKDSDYRNSSLDNAFMWGASKADEIGWSAIWKAVKREVAAQHKELAVGSEEFLKKCGERFTEVVVYTQVYDSVNSRSGMMRSKKDLDKFATSFMGEPTTTINMIENRVLKLARAVKAKEGVGKASAAMGRTVGVSLASIILTALAKSLVYAGRDDDEEDKALLERWAMHFGDSLVSDLNPLTMIPYLRDFVSIWEGWDVERPDMTVVADVVTSIKKALEEGCTLEEALALAGNVGNAFGIPVKNIIREIQGFINVFNDITDNIQPTNIGGAFAEGWTGEEQSTKDALYQAIVNGEEGKIEAIKANYKTEDAYESALKQVIRESHAPLKQAVIDLFNGEFLSKEASVEKIAAELGLDREFVSEAIDSEYSYFTNKLKKAAEALAAGEKKDYEDIVRELRERYRGIYSQDEIVKAIKEVDLEENKETDDEDNESSIYKTWMIKEAFENGDNDTAFEMIDDIVAVKTENYINDGYKQKEAESKAKASVKSTLTSYWKPVFLEADSAERAKIRKTLYATGLYGTPNDVVKTTQQWIKNSKKTK